MNYDRTRSAIPGNRRAYRPADAVCKLGGEMKIDLEYLTEEEASQFAIELLMPAEMFLKYFHEIFPSGIVDAENDPRIGRMAELFQVSEQLVIIRIKQLVR